MRLLGLLLLSSVVHISSCRENRRTLPAIVLQTDFRLKYDAVAAMKGVTRGIHPHIDVFGLPLN